MQSTEGLVVKINEEVLKSLVKSQDEVGLLVTALHNIFSFGEIFEGGVSDEHLGELFIHLDEIIRIVRAIEE